MSDLNPDVPMEDPWLNAIDRLGRADAALRAALDDVAAALREMRKETVEGASPKVLIERTVFQKTQHARRRVVEASEEYGRAITNFRATFVRGLVEQGMNFSEISRHMEVSRQMVTRLYKMSVSDSQP